MGVVAVVCRSGNRSLSGTVILKKGLDLILSTMLQGGMIHWEGQGVPCEQITIYQLDISPAADLDGIVEEEIKVCGSDKKKKF